MYLYLGEDTVVKTADVVGIFDLDKTTIDRATRDFLADAEKGGRVITVSPELPRSFVVCHEKAVGDTVYICQISAATLRKRAKIGLEGETI